VTGLAQVILTDKELAQIHAWYVAHMLAEENTLADDLLAGRLLAHMAGVTCPTT
jgi:hypothetical protein